MCVCLVEQSEIGGAGGGLTGEQVDSGLTHTDRTGHQVSLSPYRKENLSCFDEKISCQS